MRKVKVGKARAVPNREQGLRDFCEWIPEDKRGLIVEIGSWIGESALIFSDYFQQVVCIDPWEQDAALTVGCGAWLSGATADDVYDQFINNIKERANIAYIRATGNESWSSFPPHTINVVYCDADHTEKGTLAELIQWHTRVAYKGIMAGHDYEWNKIEDFKEDPWPGVKQAVDMLYGKPDRVFQDTTWAVQL